MRFLSDSTAIEGRNLLKSDATPNSFTHTHFSLLLIFHIHFLMFSLFAFILLLNAVLALPSPHSIQITGNLVSVSDTPSRRDPIGGLRGKLEADRARAQYLTQQAQQKGREKAQQKRREKAQQKAPVNLNARQSFAFGIPMTCIVTNCFVTVGVGIPPTNYSLIVDTGSSNTWVGANKPFVRTSSTVDTGQNVSVSYGTGSFSGSEVFDTLTLAPGISINQSIGVARTSEGFDEDTDGIIGMALLSLTGGSLIPSGDEILTVMDNLLNQGIIGNRVLGLSAARADQSGPGIGELFFGSTDSTKFTGNIGLTPLSGPTGLWDLEETISYGSTTLLQSGTGVFDSGTTLLLMGSNIFQTYKTATGATVEPFSGLLQLSQQQFAKLQNLNFVISGVTYSLAPEDQVLSPSEAAALDVDPSGIFLIAGDLGTDTKEGINIIHGLTFLTKFYSVYQSDTSVVGLAPAARTSSTGN